jgi:hypothetical protein
MGLLSRIGDDRAKPWLEFIVSLNILANLSGVADRSPTIEAIPAAQTGAENAYFFGRFQIDVKRQKT